MILSITAGDAPRVAVACDDGVLRVFTAEGLSPGLTYHRSMPALGSRLLSVAWHPSGQSVLVGTAVSTMHAWHLASSRELMRINNGAWRLPCCHALPPPNQDRSTRDLRDCSWDCSRHFFWPVFNAKAVEICTCAVLTHHVEHMWALVRRLLSSKVSVPGR